MFSSSVICSAIYLATFSPGCLVILSNIYLSVLSWAALSAILILSCTISYFSWLSIKSLHCLLNACLREVTQWWEYMFDACLKEIILRVLKRFQIWSSDHLESNLVIISLIIVVKLKGCQDYCFNRIYQNWDILILFQSVKISQFAYQLYCKWLQS